MKLSKAFQALKAVVFFLGKNIQELKIVILLSFQRQKMQLLYLLNHLQLSKLQNLVETKQLLHYIISNCFVFSLIFSLKLSKFLKLCDPSETTHYQHFTIFIIIVIVMMNTKSFQKIKAFSRFQNPQNTFF